MKRVIVIVGPTASGKTRVSVELAKAINGEIISADSMQVYKYMDIGTAKATEAEMGGIKHYLINEVEPDEEFSVASYQKKACGYIEHILEKGKIPIIVGGTGLYINSLIYNINFSETISDWELRSRLKQEAQDKGNEYLHDKLREVDPNAAEKLHVNDVKRVIRALEVYEHTKKPISYHQEMSRINPPGYEYIIIGLTMDRARLYDRINRRVDQMFAEGLLDEVEKLVSMGYDKNDVAMQGIGYKEVLSHLGGKLTFEEAVDLIKKGSRHYAKRQLTWFKRIENIFWVHLEDEAGGLVKGLEIIKNYIATFGIY